MTKHFGCKLMMVRLTNKQNVKEQKQTHIIALSGGDVTAKVLEALVLIPPKLKC